MIQDITKKTEFKTNGVSIELDPLTHQTQDLKLSLAFLKEYVALFEDGKVSSNNMMYGE